MIGQNFDVPKNYTGGVLPVDLSVLLEKVICSGELDGWVIEDLRLLLTKLGFNNIDLSSSEIARSSYMI